MVSQKETYDMVSLQRIRREVRQIEQDEDGIAASVGGQLQIFQSPDDAFAFTAVMAGPMNSPYQNGIFTISIQLPADYPFHPPKMKFTTKIWHPNVDFNTGRILLDVLTDNWNMCWTLQSILLTVFSVLQDPILEALPRNQANHEAADAYRNNGKTFQEVAAHKTELYAGTRNRISRLVNMGFDEGLAEVSLQRHGWNEDAAVAELLAFMDLGDGVSAA